MPSEQELIQQIIEKAWSDAQFKSQLLDDPKAAIKAEFDIDIPATIEVEAVEETSNKYYLVIPQNPAEVASVDDEEAARWL